MSSSAEGKAGSEGGESKADNGGFVHVSDRDSTAAALQRNRALLRRTLDDPSLEVHTGP